jgi:hypothetical protein
MKFDTKIAVILREDLAVWQKLNVTTFMVSGIAGTTPGIIGQNYEDGSGNVYLPMFIQPVMVYSATQEQIKTAYERALSRELRFAIFTEELFSTGHDEANRAAVKAVPQPDLKLVGLALRAEKGAVDKVVKGLPLHS